MQTVSENWKNAHKRSLLNESFVEVSLDIADPDALADASPQDNGAIYTSDSSQLARQVDKITSPYCTLEQNLWILDGNRKAIPVSEFADDTYTSDVMCDETCVFPTKRPTITIEFGNVHSKLIPGITIYWSEVYGEYADTFEVIAYDSSNAVIATKEVTGNKSVKTLIPLDIVDYKRVVVIIKKWCLPHRRARIEGILVGLNKVYGKADLFAYSHKQSVDPLSTSLPKFEISFSVDNVEGEYNPHNPQGLAKYLMERQEVKARYGLKMDDGSIEWIDGGIFYLSEWYAKQNGMTADFTARDLLEFMSDVYADIELPTEERDLYNLAEIILNMAHLPVAVDNANRWRIDGSLRNIKTTAPLPEDTLANHLQLIANAGKCVLYQNRDGVLCIEPMATVTDTAYEINSSNSYSKSEISLSKPLKQVKVKVYAYTQEAGKDIEYTSTEVAYSEASSNTIGETIVVDNPLITDSTHAESVAKWMYEYLSNRMTLDSSWRADVRLDALDVTKNSNDYNTSRVLMTDVDFKYNGAFRGTGKGKVIGNG